MPNRLINESSPYLQQHAHNPVDWFPWSNEALDKARLEDKPILLSVGYSACHWCHVMAHESFEDEETARLLNEHFVSIKVDREERPDIDSIYMSAVQAMTGQGGWPMTVFLTPNGKPFYGGTYFPPEDRHGMPAFRRVLLAVAEAYTTRQNELADAAAKLAQQLDQGRSIESDSAPLTDGILHQAFTSLASQFDESHGGFSGAPKFPQPMICEFLLRYYHRTKNRDALNMVEFTLDNMAFGGMYDQLGGGFHRYSTDDHWLVPHFEKMLYDNALLARLYLHAYQVTGKPLYRRIVQETLDYVLRDMTDPQGGFYSAQDADSEGEEGKYYVWRPQEITDVLGKNDARNFCHYYGITESGNFDGSNILHVAANERKLAQELGVSLDDLNNSILNAKARLLAHRQKRVPPARDEKVLTAWNGLVLRSLAEAALVLQQPAFLEAAKKNASFLLKNLRQNGRILRTYRDGHAKLNGYLEDYAFLIEGLIALHEATLETHWLQEAIDLLHSMLDLFWDDKDQTFYDTGSDHETLIIRPKDIFDNAVPSGSSTAVDVLLRLALITGDDGYAQKSSSLLQSMKGLMSRFPSGLANWLCALDFHLSSPKEIVIVGPAGDPSTLSLLKAAGTPYIPNKVLVGIPSDNSSYTFNTPLFQGRSTVNGSPTAYVCQNYACQLPVTSPDELTSQLKR